MIKRIIETKNLVLRNFNLNDFSDFWEFISQENVTRRAGWAPFKENEKALALESIQIYATERPLYFAIQPKNLDKVVGSIQLVDADEMNAKALNLKSSQAKEIGYILNEKFWNKGIMTEALQGIIKFFFQDLKPKQQALISEYYKPNYASGRIQEKTGFKKYNEIFDALTWYETGKKTDLIQSRITRQDFENHPIYKTFEINVKEEKE